MTMLHTLAVKAHICHDTLYLYISHTCFSITHKQACPSMRIESTISNTYWGEEHK